MNSSSLHRATLPAVALLAVGLTLTGCGNNGGSGGSSGSTLNGGGATSQNRSLRMTLPGKMRANGSSRHGTGTRVTVIAPP